MLDAPTTTVYGLAVRLGKRLNYARLRRGITQQELADAASTPDAPISQAAISALEKRDSETTVYLFQFAKALRINPEWLQDGKGDPGLEAHEWKPLPLELQADEKELLQNYRAATKRWRLSLLLMSRLKADEAQDELSEGMNILMAKIVATPYPAEKMSAAWTRPDRRAALTVQQPKGKYKTKK